MTRSKLLHIVVAATVVALGVTFAPASSAAPVKKTFTASALVTDGEGHPAVLGDTSVLVSYTLTNTTRGPQTFGSANITVPEGVTVDELPLPDVNPDYPGFSVSYDSESRILALRSTVNSGVLPGDSITIDVWVTGGSGCGVVWTTAVKQSNDFSGSGNDLIGTGTSPGQRLEWTTDTSDTQFDTAMTPHPAVTAYNGCGGIDSTVAAIQVTDTAAQLSTTGGTLTSGVLTLANVTFKTYDFSDTLIASATGYASATSSAFYVAQVLVPCEEGTSCTASANDSGKTTYATILANGSDGDPADTLWMSVKGDPATQMGSCNQDTEAAPLEPAYGAVVTFNIETRTKTVVMRLPKKYVNFISNNGTPFMDVCLQLPNGDTFTDKFGNDVPTGFLPDCTKDRTDICITDRRKNGGDELITFVLPEGDPKTSWF